jgi:hypothetical protein
MLGNVGSGQVRAWATGEGLQQTMTGNEIVTTVFGVPIDTEARGAAFPFVNVAPTSKLALPQQVASPADRPAAVDFLG